MLRERAVLEVEMEQNQLLGTDTVNKIEEHELNLRDQAAEWLEEVIQNKGKQFLKKCTTLLYWNSPALKSLFFVK